MGSAGDQTQLLRNDIALHPPSGPKEMTQYMERAVKLLRAVQSLVQMRTAIQKYAERLSPITIALFSISPASISAFYRFLLRCWPRGNSEKVREVDGGEERWWR